MHPSHPVQARGLAAGSAEAQDLTFEAPGVAATHDVYDQPLEPTRVQVEHYVEDAERAHPTRRGVPPPCAASDSGAEARTPIPAIIPNRV